MLSETSGSDSSGSDDEDDDPQRVVNYTQRNDPNPDRFVLVATTEFDNLPRVDVYDKKKIVICFDIGCNSPCHSETWERHAKKLTKQKKWESPTPYFS